MSHSLNKFRLTAILFFATALPLSAAEELLVYVKGQDAPAFDCWLTDKPTLFFNQEGLIVRSDLMETTLSYTYADIALIEFKSNETDILTDIDETAEQLKPAMQFRYTDVNTIYVDGVGSDMSIQQYSIDGKSARLDAERSGDAVTIRLHHLPQGIYIIRIGNQSYKIYKK